MLMRALMLLLADLLTLASPAARNSTTNLGPVRFTTYAVLLALFVPWVLRAAYGAVANGGTLIKPRLLLTHAG